MNKKFVSLKSRHICLLLLVSLNFSCKNESINSNKNDAKKIRLLSFEKDSLTISVQLPPKKSTGLNLNDKYGRLYYLDFVNTNNKDTVIFKRVAKNFKNQIINYYGGLINNGKIIEYNHYYLIDSAVCNLSLKYKDGNVFINKPIDIITVDSIYRDYKDLNKRIHIDYKKIEIDTVLDRIYKKYKKRYEKNRLLTSLNHFHYIVALQKMKTSDLKIENFLKNIDSNPIQSDVLYSVLFYHIKNRINELNFDELNPKYYSEEYIKLFSTGLFNFLRHEDNKGDIKYQPATDWLKTTDLYKNDSIYIKKEITPLNNKMFKSSLKKLTFINTNEQKNNLNKIIKENPSNYYLIDFWATWCSPCIQGVKTMKKMILPKNIKVISISIDKQKEKQKWITMTNKLEQSITYWLDETNDNTKGFMTFIEMQSVPRYILIDKNMNLIDQAFYHPQEPQFLPKLQDVQNHKYW